MSLHATTIYDAVNVDAPAPKQGQTPNQLASNQADAAWGEDGFSFGDFLDIINPLQHIPVISTFYRAITGDEISPGARLAGGGLFGGMPGLAFAAANQLIENDTGQDLGEHMIAAVIGDDLNEPEPPAKTLLAQAPSPQTSPGAASGSEIPAAAVQPVNFFTPRSGSQANQAQAPAGGMSNMLFQPLTMAQQEAPLPPSPKKTVAALANDGIKAADAERQLARLAADARASQAMAKGETIGQTPPSAAAPSEEREKLNRQALLAVAKDLKGVVEAHEAYNTSARLRRLYQAHEMAGQTAQN